ncbi:hypothetical protein BCIN_03g08290 [Botrytis cinerea B05.10]|uniref:Uncharacterized protein n=2 Tax=Botryotinia fuckeliana TaxID=40559 RepID=A0A384JDG3_BOTFB|nr:hypothetical protein BCIN_03g08290 [Botrytis cinerea B05.10]ATZ48639.1 hypothetical protein BCIN_03g08290 [Botrytis cinerea B05.10]EMR81278.1 hypothetical protein BcDW1_10106 [Botrytis cinerea BcDW1]
MADEDVSDADNVRIRDFVVRFLYDYNLPQGEGISGTAIQQPYLDRLDRALVENPALIKKQKKTFKIVVSRMLDEGTTLELLENNEGKGVLRLYDFVRPRDIDLSSTKFDNENNSDEYAVQPLQPNVKLEKSLKSADRNLREGIDPNGLAPRFRKRRIIEVEESDGSGNDTPSISHSRLDSRNFSPQRLARPALAPLDGNRRISVPEQFYSSSIQSEPYQHMDFSPNTELKNEYRSSLPIWLQRGLSELRQKYPDSRFKPTDLHDIKCMDCDTEHKISKYKKTNNFENHLKSKTHLENVKFRVENSTPSRPISAMSIYSAMPPPPLPVHAPPAIPVAGVSDNSSANGGLIESMIANAIQQSIGPLTAHIGNLETRLLSSENIHKHRFEEMARQLDESETRNRELFSQLEECKLSTEELSARLFAAEARSKEQAEISRRLKLVEQANESLQASRSSHSAQLKDAQGSIKALKQAPIPSIESAIQDQGSQLFILGQQHEGTAHDLSRHCKLEEEFRRKMLSQMEDERQKLNERVNLLQTALASRHEDFEELKNRVSHAPQHDQSQFDELKSQISLDFDTQARQFSSRIKSIEKKIVQDSTKFTALDHRTAEWIDTTDKKHDSRLAELETLIGENFVNFRADITNHIENLKKQLEEKNGSVEAIFEGRLAAAERTITAMKNQLTGCEVRLEAGEKSFAQLMTNIGLATNRTELLASEWKRWQADREEELRNLDTEVMKNSSAMEKLQIEHVAFLDSTPKTIREMEKRLEEHGQISTIKLQERLESSEANLRQMICSLQETQVKHRQSTLELHHKRSDTLMNRMDEKVESLERAYDEFTLKTKENQKVNATLMDQKMQNRLKTEAQIHKEMTESLIQNFVYKRDRELQAKYEETFRPMLLRYLTEKDEALRKKYDENIETAFQARMIARETELEMKYEKRFKPLIESFLTNHQKILRDEYEARIEKLLNGVKDEIISADKENRNPGIKTEEELKSLVLNLTEERESAFSKKHGADIEELVDMHRIEMVLLEEQTLERLLTLEQMIQDQGQQIEDLDCVLPLVLYDVNELMKKRRLRDRGLRRDHFRVGKGGR